MARSRAFVAFAVVGKVARDVLIPDLDWWNASHACRVARCHADTLTVAPMLQRSTDLAISFWAQGILLVRVAGFTSVQSLYTRRLTIVKSLKTSYNLLIWILNQ